MGCLHENVFHLFDRGADVFGCNVSAVQRIDVPPERAKKTFGFLSFAARYIPSMAGIIFSGSIGFGGSVNGVMGKL